jgi:hypothetical protein
MSWKTWLRAIPIAAVCLGMLTVAGCGAVGAPKTVNAKLKAQYDDDTPLPMECILVLYPEGGAADYTVATGMPISGEYTLSTTYENKDIDGAPPGKYKVTVRAAALEGGKRPTEECGDEKTTPLKIEINDSGTVTPNPLKVPLAK